MQKRSIFKSSILFFKKSKYSRKKPTLKLMKSQNSLYFIQSRTINENIIYEQDIRWLRFLALPLLLFVFKIIIDNRSSYVIYVFLLRQILQRPRPPGPATRRTASTSLPSLPSLWRHIFPLVQFIANSMNLTIQKLTNKDSWSEGVELI